MPLPGDYIDHTTHAAGTILHGSRSANNFNPFNVPGQKLGKIACSGPTSVKQHKHVALQVVSMGIGSETADSNRYTGPWILLNMTDILFLQQPADSA